MALKKITTEVTFKAPAWGHCNMQGDILGRPSKDKCRFCVKEKGCYRCALYNEILGQSDGILINKTDACKRATAGYKTVVEDIEDPLVQVDTATQVDPKIVIKTTLDEYIKLRKQLVAQGYPGNMADKVAYEYIMGG